METSEIIAISASIGTCVSAIATLLTVREISKQRKSSHKPEIAFFRTNIIGTTDTKQSGEIPNIWKNNPDEQHSCGNFPFLYLHNIGSGAAKDIEISWSFPIGEVAYETNFILEQHSENKILHYENGSLCINHEHSHSMSLWRNQKNQKIDFLLPVGRDSKAIKIIIPPAYILATSSFIYASSISKHFEQLSNIRPLYCTINYNDIDNYNSTRYVKINFDITCAHGNGDKFEAILTPQGISKNELMDQNP
ncbi:hypothetical protein [Fundidesulfovibrio terrae]|uniref:hypothetical protein n=1 Tax=Fundidesulfovibrio terrae TaxID=2922866 RepID=UPI001FAF8ABE|nr:hypothetical protein [Fundidesulfovibrio terrae]